MSASSKRKPQALTIEDACRILLSGCLVLYQSELFNDDSKYIIIEKSRRIGITWALALRAVIRRACGVEPIDLNFSSSDFNAALEFIVYCKAFAEAINGTLGYEAIPVSEWTQDVAKFANGSRIFALSSDPKVFRGRKDEVILDEFAFSEQQTEVYKAAQPLVILRPDTQLVIVSTHNGPETMFNRICRAAEQGKPLTDIAVDGMDEEDLRDMVFSWHRTTLEDACEQGFALRVQGKHQLKLVEIGEAAEGEQTRYTEESFRACNRSFINRIRAGCATEEDYEQEYNCVPAKFSCMIQPAEYDKLVLVGEDKKKIVIPEELDPNQNYGELFIGIDCGRSKDLTVVWVWERGVDRKAPPHLADVFRLACCMWMKNEPFPIQEERIRPIATHPAVVGGLIDPGAVGRGLADSVVDECGDIFKFFAFNNTRMGRAAELFRQMVQQRRCSMHPDPYVRADVLCVRRTQTATGQKKYGGSTKDTHGDFFWAGAMGLEAAKLFGGFTMTIPGDDDTDENDGSKATAA